MLVERNDKEIIIRLPASIDVGDLQDFIDYARYMEIVSKFKVKQKDVDKLSNEIKKSWWSENKKRVAK